MLAEQYSVKVILEPEKYQIQFKTHDLHSSLYLGHSL